MPTQDDLVAAFQMEGVPVRGRIARLGPVIDEILTRHAYPEPVANLLGEACALAALVGASLKFDGRLILQAQGNGPVAYVVADYDTDGGLRGYCRFDADRVAGVSTGFARPGAKTLLGDGVFVMTIDQGAESERYQGMTTIDGETLALSAEHYFAQSEQTPTRVRLGVGQVQSEGAQAWRAGGLILQNIAGDDARGPTEDAWETAEALIGTVGEEELVDPALPSDRLLYRLFHETGVRMFEPHTLRPVCRCSQDRIETVLKSFPPDERAGMVEADGMIRVTCEYCSRTYAVAPETVD